jgi:rhodanese-related sulfurtransferase
VRVASRIDVDELLDLVAGGAALVDVLPETIYRQEHVPGALSMPLATFRPERLAGFDRSAPIVVYCFDQH